jgi:LacI family transcriptional regulator
MPVTIKDIARIAGVNHSTVSRCLNDKPGVSDAVRAEIKKIAADLGFEFNANARGLNTSKTNTIGIIMDEDYQTGNLHFFTNTFLRHIRQRLEKEDLDTITTFPRNNVTGKDNIRKLVKRRRVDGLIILSSAVTKETVDFLRERSVPFIFSHRIPPEDFGQVNGVYCDHYRGGYLATERLIERGCRNILCLVREDDRDEFNQRTRGYEAALKDAGLPVNPDHIVPGGYSLNCGKETVKRLEPLLDSIDGIFAHTDVLALGVMKELKKRGINIPGDIALIGYDDIELCSYVEPGLSSISQPSRDISVETCDRLLRLMAGEELMEKTVLPPRIVLRESC